MFTRQITVVLAVALAASGVAAQGTGQATWYNPGLGSCGISNSDSDLIVAVSATTFDQFPGATGNPNNNPICNRGIQISYGGKTVIAHITDRCVRCQGASIDLSPALFSMFAPLSQGVIQGVQWSYI